MHRGMWELAAIIFLLTVLTYGAYIARSALVYVFSAVMLIAVLFLILWVIISLRHKSRMLDIEYMERVHVNMKVIEMDRPQNVNMIEAPKQQQSWVDELAYEEPITVNVPQPRAHTHELTKQLPMSDEHNTLYRAEVAYKAGATNRDKLRAALGVSRSKASELIRELQLRRRI